MMMKDERRERRKGEVLAKMGIHIITLLENLPRVIVRVTEF